MDDILFQEIFNEVEPVLPDGWQKFALYIGYALGRYSMKYYTAGADGVYTDCFKQGISKAQLIKIFMNIDRRIEPVRNALDGKDKWTVMTMLVTSDGHMRAEFDYMDISENMISYEREWGKKYLK